MDIFESKHAVCYHGKEYRLNGRKLIIDGEMRPLYLALEPSLQKAVDAAFDDIETGWDEAHTEHTQLGLAREIDYYGHSIICVCPVEWKEGNMRVKNEIGGN